MEFKGYWSRWHRYDDKGVKYIKKFEIDQTPDPLIEPGYTEWKRGTGQLSEQARANITEAIRASCAGKPKPPEQREKMRQAKLGKPKTEAHKQAMRMAWQRKRHMEDQELQERYRQAREHINRMRAQ